MKVYADCYGCNSLHVYKSVLERRNHKMDRFYKAKESNGYQDIFPEDSPLLKYLAFGKISLKEGQEYTS